MYVPGCGRAVGIKPISYRLPLCSTSAYRVLAHILSPWTTHKISLSFITRQNFVYQKGPVGLVCRLLKPSSPGESYVGIQSTDKFGHVVHDHSTAAGANTSPSAPPTPRYRKYQCSTDLFKSLYSFGLLTAGSYRTLHTVGLIN